MDRISHRHGAGDVGTNTGRAAGPVAQCQFMGRLRHTLDVDVHEHDMRPLVSEHSRNAIAETLCRACHDCDAPGHAPLRSLCGGDFSAKLLYLPAVDELSIALRQEVDIAEDVGREHDLDGVGVHQACRFGSLVIVTDREQPQVLHQYDFWRESCRFGMSGDSGSQGLRQLIGGDCRIDLEP